METTPGRQHYRGTFECPVCDREFKAVTEQRTPKPTGFWARCGSCESLVWSDSLTTTKDWGMMQ